jgi:8-oxo-dGTP diphosphatase
MSNELKIGRDYVGVGQGILIFNDNNRVLLMKRGKKAKNEVGWWTKPGGEIEYGETAMESVKREIKEELDVEVEIWGYCMHTDHIIKDDNQHWLAINFLGRIKSGELKNMEPHKCDELKWFNLNNLPEKLVQTTREAIENYLNKKYIRL